MRTVRIWDQPDLLLEELEIDIIFQKKRERQLRDSLGRIGVVNRSLMCDERN